MWREWDVGKGGATLRSGPGPVGQIGPVEEILWHVRHANLEKPLGALGGRLEAFYYAFADADVVGIAELPDNVTTAALALTINASGVVQVKTTVLMTPEEVYQAAKKSVSYRPPGR